MTIWNDSIIKLIVSIIIYFFFLDIFYNCIFFNFYEIVTDNYPGCFFVLVHRCPCGWLSWLFSAWLGFLTRRLGLWWWLTVPRLLLVVMGVVVVLRGESVTLCTSARTVYAVVHVCVRVHMAVSGGSGAVDGEWLVTVLASLWLAFDFKYLMGFSWWRNLRTCHSWGSSLRCYTDFILFILFIFILF